MACVHNIRHQNARMICVAITHFQCCAKRSVGAAVEKCQNHVVYMIIQHLKIIIKLKINQWNKILFIYHAKTKLKLASNMYSG